VRYSFIEVDFAYKRERCFEDRVESLPNSQRVWMPGKLGIADLEFRQKDILERLAASYGTKT
jgi:hypothetical protein